MKSTKNGFNSTQNKTDRNLKKHRQNIQQRSVWFSDYPKQNTEK